MTQHPMTGHAIDPEAGVIYGRQGRPIGAPDAKGYLHIGYRKGGSQIGLLAHRMIWESVHGKIPTGMTINHKNAIKNDNRIENLEMVTQKENIHHAIRLGLSPRGDSHPNSKLTSECVKAIRERHAAGESKRSLSSEYGVGERHIYQITTGRRWAVA